MGREGRVQRWRHLSRHSCFCLQYTFSCFPACSLEITFHFVREQPAILQTAVPTFYKRGCEQDWPAPPVPSSSISGWVVPASLTPVEASDKPVCSSPIRSHTDLWAWTGVEESLRIHFQILQMCWCSHYPLWKSSLLLIHASIILRAWMGGENEQRGSYTLCGVNGI